jgi:hypothetical protein
MFILHHILLIAFSVTLFAAENSSLALFPNRFFISENQVTPPFEKLLKLHSVNYATPTLPDIVAATQKCWLRNPNTERWDLPNVKANQETVELFKVLGLVNAIEPQNQNFDYAVIFGANIQTMRKNLAYLLKLYTTKNVRFNEIIFLVGDRKRDSVFEAEAVLKNEENRHLKNKEEFTFCSAQLPSNETEIAKMIWAQAQLGDLYNLPVTFVDTPATVTTDGKTKRPTTIDTVREWKDKYGPNPDSSILAIAPQPHFGRQRLIIETLLDDFKIEVAGPGKQKIKSPLFFDAIARQLYSMHAAAHQKIS